MSPDNTPINQEGAVTALFTPLLLSNKEYSFNFVSYRENPQAPVSLSVTANSNAANGQFSSISLKADEAHKLSSSLQGAIQGNLSGQHTIAARKTSSLVLSMENNSLTLYLNKNGLSSSYIRLDRFGANLIRMKVNEHLCKLFDLPEDVVCKMISSVSM